MFNVVINNEQYDEFLGQKDTIKELKKQVDYWKEEFDSLYDNYQQALSEKKVLKDENDKLLEKAKQVEASDGICEKLMKENGELKEKIKMLEASNALLKGNLESTYGNYKQALSVKEALIKERNELINVRGKLYDELENTNIRFKELVTDNYRLKMSNNGFKENNKKLKKQNEILKYRIKDFENQEDNITVGYVKRLEQDNYALREENNDLEELNEKLHYAIRNLSDTNDALEKEKKELKDGIAEMAEKATNPDYVKFLETVKKFQESNADILTELDEIAQPARNLNIENLYITNNYFSKEDEGNE